jgi:hypothetical protein
MVAVFGKVVFIILIVKHHLLILMPMLLAVVRDLLFNLPMRHLVILPLGNGLFLGEHQQLPQIKIL